MNYPKYTVEGKFINRMSNEAALFAGSEEQAVIWCNRLNEALDTGRKMANEELVEALREMLVLADLDGGNFVKPTSPTLIRARAALAKHGGQQ